MHSYWNTENSEIIAFGKIDNKVIAFGVLDGIEWPTGKYSATSWIFYKPEGCIQITPKQF